MKKIFTASIIIILAAIVIITVSIDDLKREHVCLIFNIGQNDVADDSFCNGSEIQLKGFDDVRFKGDKGSKFKWMSVEKDSVSYFFGLYSLAGNMEPAKEKHDELKLQDSNVHDIEKPSFPDVQADIVAVILKIEGNSESIEEAIEEIFLHFQTDFREPDIFYVYGAKISEKIKLFNNAEIVYIYNKPEILITDLTIIRSDKEDLYLKNNGTKRITVK